MIRPHPARTAATLLVCRAALVLAVLAPVAGCSDAGPGDAHPSSSPQEITVSISLLNGAVTPQEQKINVPVGTTVDFLVTSDHKDEVDVSDGPDLRVGPNQTIHGTFVAKKAGSDEIWSSSPPVLIATLTVS